MYSADSTMPSVTASDSVLSPAGRVRVNVTSSPSSMLSASAVTATGGASLSRMRTSNREASNVMWWSGDFFASLTLKSSSPSTSLSSIVLMRTRCFACACSPSASAVRSWRRTTGWRAATLGDSSRRRKSVR